MATKKVVPNAADARANVIALASAVNGAYGELQAALAPFVATWKVGGKTRKALLDALTDQPTRATVNATLSRLATGSSSKPKLTAVQRACAAVGVCKVEDLDTVRDHCDAREAELSAQQAATA